jgi:cation transport ATPase/YHS domain-containing protein
MSDPRRYSKDPICGKEVDKLRASAVVLKAGKTHYFCSDGCKEAFLSRAEGEREPGIETRPPIEKEPPRKVKLGVAPVRTLMPSRSGTSSKVKAVKLVTRVPVGLMRSKPRAEMSAEPTEAAPAPTLMPTPEAAASMPMPEAEAAAPMPMPEAEAAAPMPMPEAEAAAPMPMPEAEAAAPIPMPEAEAAAPIPMPMPEAEAAAPMPMPEAEAAVPIPMPMPEAEAAAPMPEAAAPIPMPIPMPEAAAPIPMPMPEAEAAAPMPIPEAEAATPMPASAPMPEAAAVARLESPEEKKLGKLPKGKGKRRQKRREKKRGAQGGSPDVIEMNAFPPAIEHALLLGTVEPLLLGTVEPLPFAYAEDEPVTEPLLEEPEAEAAPVPEPPKSEPSPSPGADAAHAMIASHGRPLLDLVISEAAAQVRPEAELASPAPASPVEPEAASIPVSTPLPTPTPEAEAPPTTPIPTPTPTPTLEAEAASPAPTPTPASTPEAEAEAEAASPAPTPTPASTPEAEAEAEAAPPTPTPTPETEAEAAPPLPTPEAEAAPPTPAPPEAEAAPPTPTTSPSLSLSPEAEVAPPRSAPPEAEAAPTPSPGVEAAPSVAKEHEVPASGIFPLPLTRQLMLTVSGMTCPSCALRVERAIRRVPGIISASVDFALSGAIVEMGEPGSEPDAPTALQVQAQLIDEIRRVGYKVSLGREPLATRLPLFDRWLFARFGLAALLLASLSAIGLGGPRSLLMAALALPIIAVSGLPILLEALARARHLAINSSTFTSIGAIGGYVLAVREAFARGNTSEASTFFEASAAVVTFALLAQLLQRRATAQLLISFQHVAKSSPEHRFRLLDAHLTKGTRHRVVEALVRVGLPASLLAIIVVYGILSSLQLGPLRTFVPLLTMLAAITPQALVLAVALVAGLGLQRAAQRNVFFHDVEALEKLAAMTDLVTTKSVVSQGTPVVEKLEVLEGATRQEVLSLLATCEAGSRQPVGRALYNYAAGEGVKATALAELEKVRGYGLRAVVSDRAVLIGSRALMETNGIDLRKAGDSIAEFAFAGQTVAYIAVEGRLAAVVGMSDRVRSGVSQIMTSLKRMRIQTTLLTSDTPQVARQMARQAGIDEIIAETAPEQRARRMSDTRGPDHILAVASDPNRDGELMEAADVSIAVEEVIPSQCQPSVWLPRGTLADLLPAIEVAKQVRKIEDQNAAIAIIGQVLLLAAGAFGVLGHHGPLIAGGVTALLPLVLSSSARRVQHHKPVHRK